MTMLAWDVLFFVCGAITGGGLVLVIMRRRELRRRP